MAIPQGPALAVGTAHCVTVIATGSYLPMALVTGMVNQTLPAPSTATNSGCPYPAGSVTTVGQVLVLGSNRPILPGGVEAEQLGDGSQPGMATQTFPLLSKVVPQGSPPGAAKSVTLLMLD